MESFLIEPTETFVNRVLESKHFLNCPKHLFNYHLDCMFRQGMGGKGKEEALENVLFYLNKYGVASAKIKAKTFVEWRSSITVQKFDEINVNDYVDNPPAYITKMLNQQQTWTKAHTEYYPFTGIVKFIPSYPCCKL